MNEVEMMTADQVEELAVEILDWVMDLELDAFVRSGASLDRIGAFEDSLEEMKPRHIAHVRDLLKRSLH